MMKRCPTCGSDRVDTFESKERIEISGEGRLELLLINDVCAECKTEGDFSGANDARIEAARKTARGARVSRIIDQLKGRYSMAFMERALTLPARTMMRWKSGDVSAAAFALLRFLGIYPWLIEVADAGFSHSYSYRKLAAEGEKAEAELESCGVSQSNANDCTAKFEVEISGFEIQESQEGPVQADFEIK